MLKKAEVARKNYNTYTLYVSKKLGEKRKQLGLSCKQIADELGVNQATIWKWEKGLKIPKQYLRDAWEDLIDYLDSPELRKMGDMKNGK